MTDRRVEGSGERSGLQPAAAVAVVLTSVVLVLGVGFLVGRRIVEPSGVGGTSGIASGALGQPEQPAAAGGRLPPTPAATASVRDAAAAASTGTLPNGAREGRAATPATAIVVRAGQPADREDAGSTNATTRDQSDDSTKVATTPGAIVVRAAATAQPPGTRLADAPRVGADPSIDTQISDPLADSPVPVDLPSIVALGGADVAVGPDGVQTSGARTFAQLLLARAHDRDPDLADDPALQQIAEGELMNQLALAELTGMPRPARLVRGSVIVQIEVVGPLAETHSAALRLPPSRSVPAVGLAVGVVQRAEPGYLPDLVTVAAVAYR